MKTANQLDRKQKSHHIMVVDDESHVGLFIEALLTSRGFKVTRCTDSKEALSRFAINPGSFDLVVTDQNMPKMCGTELAKKLLALRCNLPIILCSGSSYEDIEQLIGEIGISAYLSKPLQVNELLRQIDKLIKGDRYHYSYVTNI